MSYEGTVQNGVIVLSGGEKLPEGTRVRVETPTPAEEATVSEANFVDEVLKIARTIEGLPADFAEQHDHYIHGRPKR